jgi:hypothetical protein
VTTLELLDTRLRPAILGAEREAGGDAGPAHDGRLTLDDVIVGAWDGLARGRSAPCPVCAGALEPRYGAGTAPVAGRCRDCGSELS